MATTKTKIAVAAVVGVLFVGGATAVVVHSRTQTLDLQTPPVAATPVVAPQVSPPPPHAGTAPQQVAGSKVETRQVKTADGKAVSVRGAVVTSGGPEVSYQTMGHVDPEVNAKAQAAAGERLRENVKQLLTVKSIAQRLQITDHQIGQLRIALAASPASGQTANAAFVARIHGILAPEQVKAVFDLPTAGKNDGAQP